ncbi:MAG TPA: histidine kinase [Solirubrobacteraceae bacterium]|nr:histidine kinase [Solirubrobacteraceae bacterium]
MLGLKRALAALAVAGLVAGAIAIALTLSSDHEDQPVLAIVLGLPVAWSFIGTGLYAWWRRPANRFGALMTTVGFASMIGVLFESNEPLVFTIGILFGSLYLAVFAHMMLAYPDGRLQTRAQARLVAAIYAISVIGLLPVVMLAPPELFECDCPESVLRISGDRTVYEVFDWMTTTVAVGMVAAVMVILVRRWRAATAPQRRAMAPVLWSGVVLLDLLAASLIADSIGIDPLSNVLGLLGSLALFVLPWAFLFGLLRSRVSRSGAVADVLLRIGETPGTGRLRELLADALGDRSVQLAYWLEDEGRWVDGDGHAAELPRDDDPVSASTAVELEGRRLERDLHDGAQQRLVSLSLTLRLAQARVATDPVAAGGLVAAAQEELTLALAELRELARGIHPVVLSDRGLDAALKALAGRSPVPVTLAAMPDGRLPEAVEAAAYFVVAEALTNVVKYADASQATVSVTRHNGTAVVEVTDDGVGGADPRLGTGLRGLADRVAALDGRLALQSEPGRGTRLRAEIPA